MGLGYLVGHVVAKRFMTESLTEEGNMVLEFLKEKRIDHLQVCEALFGKSIGHEI